MNEGFRIAKIGQKYIFVIPLIYEFAMQGVNGTFIKEKLYYMANGSGGETPKRCRSSKKPDCLEL